MSLRGTRRLGSSRTRTVGVALAAGSLALKMNVDTETVVFAIYDIFTQGLLGYWLILAHDSANGL